MSNKHLEITKGKKGNFHELIAYLSNENAPKDINSRDYPQFVKNGLLMIHMALKTVSQRTVSSVSFKISNIETLIDNKFCRKVKIDGEILFTGKRRYEDFKEPYRFPPKAAFYFKGYDKKLNQHLQFIDNIEKQIQCLELNEYSTPKSYSIHIALNKNNIERGFEKMAEQHEYFFARFLKSYFQYKMETLIEQRGYVHNNDEDISDLNPVSFKI